MGDVHVLARAWSVEADIGPGSRERPLPGGRRPISCTGLPKLAVTRFYPREQCRAEDRFDVMWHRRTERWIRRHAVVALGEGLHPLSIDGRLQPLCEIRRVA